MEGNFCIEQGRWWTSNSHQTCVTWRPLIGCHVGTLPNNQGVTLSGQWSPMVTIGIVTTSTVCHGCMMLLKFDLACPHTGWPWLTLRYTVFNVSVIRLCAVLLAIIITQYLYGVVLVIISHSKPSWTILSGMVAISCTIWIYHTFSVIATGELTGSYESGTIQLQKSI